VALEHELVSLVGERLPAGGDVSAAALDLEKLEQAGLVEIGKSSSFGVGRLDLAFESGELGGEQLVVGAGALAGQGGLAGEEDFGAEEGGADLVEDKGVELVGADVALRTALSPPGSKAVVVGAEVVADEAVVASVGAAEPLAVGMNSARAADHQPSQEPGFIGQAPGAELGVLPADSLGGLEDILGDDRRHGDRDPFLRRS